MEGGDPRRFCGSCGRGLREEARFCGACGQAVPAAGEHSDPGGAAPAPGHWDSPAPAGGPDAASGPGAALAVPGAGAWGEAPPPGGSGAGPYDRPAADAWETARMDSPGTGSFDRPAAGTWATERMDSPGTGSYDRPAAGTWGTERADGPGAGSFDRPGAGTWATERMDSPGAGTYDQPTAGTWATERMDVPGRPGAGPYDRPTGGAWGTARMGPGAPGAMGYTGPGRDGRRLLRHPVAIAAAALIVVGGGSAAALAMQSSPSSGRAAITPSASGGPSAPAASVPPVSRGAERAAARRLSALLPASGADRGAVIDAVTNVARCGHAIPRDAATLDKAAASRRRLLSKLARLPGRPALPAPMLDDLTRAWQASEQADRDYAAWARDESHKCSKHSSSDPHYRAALGPDGRATIEKKAFASRWNRLAARFGLRRFQWTQL